MEHIDITTPVLIAGGGPFGLMSAIELARRGIASLLVDADLGTARHPQANATQARTMEHFRRLGFSDEIRQLGLPGDYPTISPTSPVTSVMNSHVSNCRRRAPLRT